MFFGESYVCPLFPLEIKMLLVIEFLTHGTRAHYTVKSAVVSQGFFSGKSAVEAQRNANAYQ